jgi:iron-sulfur cluster repair protein YtfE (RIC family)
MNVDNYRREHQEIFTEIMALAKNLYHIQENSSEIELQFKNLASQLKKHLAKEEKLLYPAIISCDDENLKITAQKFKQEIDNISDLWSAFFSTWENPEEILHNRKHFIADFKDVVQTLGRRVLMEEREFYPKIEDYFKITGR